MKYPEGDDQADWDRWYYENKYGSKPAKAKRPSNKSSKQFDKVETTAQRNQRTIRWQYANPQMAKYDNDGNPV